MQNRFLSTVKNILEKYSITLWLMIKCERMNTRNERQKNKFIYQLYAEPNSKSRKKILT